MNPAEPTAHAETTNAIVRAMTDTLLVLAYAQWCDEWDEVVQDNGAEHPDRPEDCITPGPREDYADYARLPDLSDEEIGEFRTAALTLYVRVSGEIGVDLAALAVENGLSENDAESLGYYVVMAAVGHGVAWTDSRAPLTRSAPNGAAVEVTLPCLHYTIPTWPGRFPEGA